LILTLQNNLKIKKNINLKKIFNFLKIFLKYKNKQNNKQQNQLTTKSQQIVDEQNAFSVVLEI
jgi:hypothetical protein